MNERAKTSRGARVADMAERLAALGTPDPPPAPIAAVPDHQDDAPPAAGPRARVAAMPAQQPRARTGKADSATFPVRLTQNMTYDQADELNELARQHNRQNRIAGREQVYTVSGFVRAAVAICLADQRLRARMVKLAADPEHSGRGRK